MSPASRFLIPQKKTGKEASFYMVILKDGRTQKSNFWKGLGENEMVLQCSTNPLFFPAFGGPVRKNALQRDPGVNFTKNELFSAQKKLIDIRPL